jgi:ABC-type sulfate transport system permease subunit
MQVVGERRLPEAAAPSPLEQMISNQTQTTTTPNFQQEYQHRAVWKASVMAAFNVLVLVLSARLIVLVSVGGGIWLAFIALQQPDPWRLAALGVYCVCVVLPTIVLAGIR